jgi:hypothetical protein
MKNGFLWSRGGKSSAPYLFNVAVNQARLAVLVGSSGWSRWVNEALVPGLVLLRLFDALNVPTALNPVHIVWKVRLKLFQVVYTRKNRPV